MGKKLTVEPCSGAMLLMVARSAPTALAIKFDKFPHYTELSAQLRYSQHQICGCDTRRELSGQLEADDIGYQHVYGLVQHDGFRFYSAHTPSQYAQAVHHGRVGVSANATVRVTKVLFLIEKDHLREVFKVNLMDDAGGWRNDPEILESSLPPLKKFIAFGIPFELDGFV
jgi:hypothetical protein